VRDEKVSQLMHRGRTYANMHSAHVHAHVHAHVQSTRRLHTYMHTHIHVRADAHKNAFRRRGRVICGGAGCAYTAPQCSQCTHRRHAYEAQAHSLWGAVKEVGGLMGCRSGLHGCGQRCMAMANNTRLCVGMHGSGQVCMPMARNT